MFNILEIKSNDEYFDTRDKRAEKSVYFNRYIGYNDEIIFIDFLKKFYINSQKKGVFINKTIPNPTENEILFFYSIVGENHKFDLYSITKDIRIWMGSLKSNIVNDVGEAVYTMLDIMKKQNVNENIMKNAYVKFMCWIRNVIGTALKLVTSNDVPKILYIGDISKYELYILYIAALSGCDVAYINFTSEDSYNKFDKNSIFSKPIYGVNKKNIDFDFRSINPDSIEKEEKLKISINAVSDVVCTNTWMTESFFEYINKSNSLRGTGSTPKIYNLFIRYIGIDTVGEYNNRLFNFKQELVKNKKKFLIIDNKIPNPNNDQISEFKDIKFVDIESLIFKLTESIDICKDSVRTALAQKAYFYVMKSKKNETTSRIYNHGVRLLCWIKYFAADLYNNWNIENTNLIIYYGKISEAEADFMYILSSMGMDVIYISPDKKNDVIFSTAPYAHSTVLCELQNEMVIEEFPNREVKLKVATTAFKASEELNDILYNDSGMYRTRQFTRSKPITLKTTYDEIEILWKQEAKYRPSFENIDDLVSVPNIFAKICGVENGNASAYWNKIRSMITADTIVTTQIPILENSKEHKTKPLVRGFINQGKLQYRTIKKSLAYNYDYLSDNIQDYILEKIQELLDLDWIESDESRLDLIILDTLLNIDKNTLRLIQKFDFTKEIPKLIIVDVTEAMVSLEDCIYIAFLNLVGFDIVVFTPTGYKNIEKYIKTDAFEQYNVGELMFNLSTPSLNTAPDSFGNSSGILGKLFGKGR